MEFNTNYTQNFGANLHLFLKNSFEPKLASGAFMESTSNQLYPGFPNSVQFTGQGAASNPSIGAPTHSHDPFNPYQASVTDSYLKDWISLYASSPCESDGISGLEHPWESLRLLNSPSKGPLEAMNQRAIDEKFNFQMLGLALANSPEEASCLSSVQNEHQKKAKGRKNKKNVQVEKEISKGRWKTVIIKGQWSSEEDRFLMQLVKQHGDRKWSQIAKMFPGRVGKQCRDRWQNHLRPDITKHEWSEEEDKLLIAIHKEVGNKWSEIARRLPGRSENTIKNHWNATKRRQLSSRKRGKPKYHSLLQDYIRSVTSSDDQITTQENKFLADAKPQGIGATLASLDQPKSFGYHLQHRQPMISFSSNVNVSSSSSMLGHKPGGLLINESSYDFDQGPSQLTSQLEFDLKKEMDFLEMLYQ